MPKISELLSQRTSRSVVGREREIARLVEIINHDAPLVVHLYGVAGIGKSSLLEAFATEGLSHKIRVIRLDCRLTEPTERGFLHQLSALLGQKSLTLEKASERLSRSGRRTVLALDHYEVFRLMDSWLRQTFVPALSSNIRLLLVGREPPSPAWWTAREWQGLFQAMNLEPLHNNDALTLLCDLGLSEKDAMRVNQSARGHPLALRLAASAALERPGVDFREESIQSVLQVLAGIYLDDIDDPNVKRALEASSVVRRVTRSILAAMLNQSSADLIERIRVTPLVESRSDGLMLHDGVRESIAATLRATDPNAYRDYRRAALRQLRNELRSAATPELWRYTADLIYLIENPWVREAFFPSESQQFAVEPARAEDGKAIKEITRRHEGAAAAKIVSFCWEQQPSTFRVARDGMGNVAGFYCMLDSQSINDDLLDQDPVLSRCWDHVQTGEMAKDEKVIFFRHWLSREEGELPSALQAASWLDIKRTYMELRPHFRRLYLTTCQLPSYESALRELGFRFLPECDALIDKNCYFTAMLDFGSSSVDGWLIGLVGKQLGVDENTFLDDESRELVVDGARVYLTKLEFDLLQYLSQHQGKAVSRDKLLDEVWGLSYHGGSNVVDVVIRSLRKKLGDHATMIQTVRGTGYRFKDTIGEANS